LYTQKLRGHGSNIVLDAAKVISANTGAKVYLHTADYSASIGEDQVTVVPAFAIPPRRGTGAGDSWNAGIMVADALGLTEEEELFFANAVAGRYASNPQRVYSTIREIADFLKDSTLRLKRIRQIGLERLH
jgi:sugar/nucleoside kinase (ribokinase family)